MKEIIPKCPTCKSKLSYWTLRDNISGYYCPSISCYDNIKSLSPTAILCPRCFNLTYTKIADDFICEKCLNLKDFVICPGYYNCEQFKKLNCSSLGLLTRSDVFKIFSTPCVGIHPKYDAYSFVFSISKDNRILKGRKAIKELIMCMKDPKLIKSIIICLSTL